jgi:HEAT repeat protein
MKTAGCLATVAIVLFFLASNGHGRPEKGEYEEPAYRGKFLSQWLADLKHADVAVRLRAVETLSEISWPSDQTTVALCCALRDTDVGVQRRAATYLAGTGVAPRRAVRDLTIVLTAAMKESDTSIRRKAIDALGQIGPPAREALPQLRTALQDAQEEFRWAAAVAVANIAPQEAAPVVPILTAGLDKPRAEGLSFVHWPTVFLFIKIGEPVVPALTAALRKPKAEQQFMAALLGAIGPPAKPAVPAILNLCQSADPKIRLAAAQALVNIDPRQASHVVPVLIDSLQNADSLVRDDAARMLGELGPVAKDAAPALLAGLQSEKDDPSLWFFEALGLIGVEAKETLPALLDMLKHGRPKDIIAAAYALRLLGPAAQTAVPLLRARAAVPFSLEFNPAAEALARIDPSQMPFTPPAFLFALQDKDDRWGALAALTAMGPAAKDALPALRWGLEEWSPAQRLCAIRALARIDPNEAVKQIPVLLDMLRGNKCKEAAYAAQALAQLGALAAPATPALIDALKVSHLRLPAAVALGAIGPYAKSAIPALIRLYEETEVADPQSNAETRALEKLLTDPDELVRAFQVRYFEPAMPFPAGLGLGDIVDARVPSEVRLRRHIVRALGLIGTASPEAIKLLKRARSDPDARLALLAASALVRLDPMAAPDVLPALRGALTDPHWAVRSGAAAALGEIGCGASATLSALQSLRKDPVRHVRREAAKAIWRVGPTIAESLGIPRDESWTLLLDYLQWGSAGS